MQAKYVVFFFYQQSELKLLATPRNQRQRILIRTQKSVGCKRGSDAIFFGKDAIENILSLKVYMSLYYSILTCGAVISVPSCPMPLRVSASLVLARLATK